MAEHPNTAVIAALKGLSTAVIEDGQVRVYLSRRNLETLLNKLDVNRRVPDSSACILVKNDIDHPKYPQSHPQIVVKALEDEEYYIDRDPGQVKVFH